VSGDAILNYPLGYRGVVFNEHRNSSGVLDRTKALDTILVERFDFSPLEFRDQRDGLHLLMGGDLGVVSSEFRFISIAGTVVGSTSSKFEDRIAKLSSALDPENAVADDAATRGTSIFDFYSPSDEAGYTGPIRECFFARPTGLPAIYERRGQGLTALFAGQLICVPPRRYLYTAEAKVANAGNSWTVAIPNWTAAMGAPTSGVVTLVLTAAGSNPCVLQYVDTMTGTTYTLNLNLSGIGGGAHSVTVDVANNIVKVDGTRNDAIRTSAVDSGVWQINAGGGTFSVPSGRTNLTSATLAYRQARS
jgi:hypothetical protein